MKKEEVVKSTVERMLRPQIMRLRRASMAVPRSPKSPPSAKALALTAQPPLGLFSFSGARNRHVSVNPSPTVSICAQRKV